VRVDARRLTCGRSKAMTLKDARPRSKRQPFDTGKDLFFRGTDVTDQHGPPQVVRPTKKILLSPSCLLPPGPGGELLMGVTDGEIVAGERLVATKIPTTCIGIVDESVYRRLVLVVSRYWTAVYGRPPFVPRANREARSASSGRLTQWRSPTRRAGESSNCATRFHRQARTECGGLHTVAAGTGCH
jgi:hypothetical protein